MPLPAASRQQALRGIELFAHLPGPELEALAEMVVGKAFDAGATLFFEGDSCEGLWVIAQGAARIVKSTPAGRQLVLATVQAPAAVAEVPVFDGGPYPATVTAITAVEAFLLTRADLLALCRRQPQVALRCLEAFGARLRHLVGLVERITFGSVRQRLAQALLDFSRTLGDPFALPETHEQLASRLGTVREVVSRNLGRFQSEGLIRLDRRQVEILNREGLEYEAATEI
jgi:CRP/FNR family transcriptional regulator